MAVPVLVDAQHLAAIRRKQPSSALVQHILTDHAGEEEEPEFMFQVRQRFEDALTRQSDEGVRIETSGEDSLMNTKQEWVKCFSDESHLLVTDDCSSHTSL